MERIRTTALQHPAIYIPYAASLPATFAADELQRYLERMGTRCPIVPDASLGDRHAIVVRTPTASKTPSPTHNPGGFTVIPEAELITLEGDSPRALLDAVYCLLEQLGCRWSLHGQEEERVPRLAPEPFLRAVQHTPSFAVRGYCTDIMTWHYTEPEHFDSRLADDRTFIDWMGKSGANTFFFIRHPFDTQSSITELIPEFERRGIAVEYGGHVIPLLVPRELYRDHPDYFPLSPNGARTEHGNLCTSNATALATASANAASYTRDHPEMSGVHIWGADLWHGGWCKCADCVSISVQDQSLRVCNAVAQGLADAGSTRPVFYLAYHDTLTPNLTVQPDANVIVEFAPRERCYGHALNDSCCVTNAGYAAALERYIELFEGRVRLFEYYGDAILFFGCVLPLTDVITADLEYYKRLGVTGITMLQFGTYSLWAYPLNFLSFAKGTMGYASTLPTCNDYCARFGVHAGAAIAACAELEAIMRRVATYGDIRRPPATPDAAARVVASVEDALPGLLDVASRLEQLGDTSLGAQAALVRYTHAVLDGVRQQLGSTVAGTAAPDDARYAEALQIIEAVDRRFKGLWGVVDLPIIHSFYSVVHSNA